MKPVALPPPCATRSALPFAAVLLPFRRPVSRLFPLLQAAFFFAAQHKTKDETMKQ